MLLANLALELGNALTSSNQLRRKLRPRNSFGRLVARLLAPTKLITPLVDGLARDAEITRYPRDRLPLINLPKRRKLELTAETLRTHQIHPTMDLPPFHCLIFGVHNSSVTHVSGMDINGAVPLA